MLTVGSKLVSFHYRSVGLSHLDRPLILSVSAHCKCRQIIRFQVHHLWWSVLLTLFTLSLWFSFPSLPNSLPTPLLCLILLLPSSHVRSSVVHVPALTAQLCVPQSSRRRSCCSTGQEMARSATASVGTSCGPWVRTRSTLRCSRSWGTPRQKVTFQSVGQLIISGSI